MVQQVTNGIKISVQTKFIGINYHDDRLHYAFSYEVTIENQSNDSVQLLKRHWNIFDSLNNTEMVDGMGVVGQKPILKPGGIHSYSSNCLLTSHIGAMNGFYEMVNFTTTKSFKVHIPTFQLMVSGALN
jgi:ApaG protein